MNPVRRRRSRSRRRSVARRSTRRNPISFGGAFKPFKDVLSKDMLFMTAGAIGASALTSYALQTFGPLKVVNGAVVAKGANEFKLPFSDSHWGLAAYSIIISSAGAWAAQKFLKMPSVAKGMLLSGMVMAVNEGVAAFKAGASRTAGTGEYFVPGARRLASTGSARIGLNGAGYDATNAFGNYVAQSTSAFATDAWAN